MTEYLPTIESGLSGSRSPEEDIEPWIDDLSDAREPGVYILKLSTPNDWAEVESRWKQYYEIDVPDWVRIAYDSDAVLYVGAAKDVLGRIHTHLDSPNQSTAIARVFPIHSIWDVRWFDNVEEAFDRESGIALKMDATYPNVFVRQQ